jgi:hypothetical protein
MRSSGVVSVEALASPGVCGVSEFRYSELFCHESSFLSPPWPGKHYFECSMRDDGLCRVGWSTAKASLDLGTDMNVSLVVVGGCLGQCPWFAVYRGTASAVLERNPT